MSERLFSSLKSSPLILKMSYLLVVIYAVIVFSGIKQFNVWQQIYDYYRIPHVMTADKLVPPNQGVDLTNSEIYKGISHYLNPHTPRALLMWPFIKVGNLLHIEVDRVFSYGVVLLMMLFLFCWREAFRNIIGSRHYFIEFLVVAVTLTLSLYMNGRMVWVMLATSLLLLLDRIHNKLSRFSQCLFMGAIFFTSSVSTETFCVMYFIFWLWAFQHKQMWLMALLSLLIPCALIAVLKNIDFFGGGISALEAMLRHGYGKYFTDQTLLILIPIVALSFAVMNRYFENPNLRLAKLLMVFGLISGAYGLSSIVIVITASLLIFAVKAESLMTESHRPFIPVLS